MSNKLFKVAIIGLSGTDKSGNPYGVGKSLFCNRFVRPGEDDLVLNHSSVFSPEEMSSKVINNDHFLYWGNTNMRVESSDLVSFHLAEQTVIRTQQIGFQPLDSYAHRSLQPKLSSNGKVAYICKDQYLNSEVHPIVPMPSSTEFTIDAFIIIFNVDPSITYFDEQRELLSNLIPEILKMKKPLVIAASKCDKIGRDSQLGSFYLSKLSQFVNSYESNIPIIETSALLNVNIVFSFQMLYSISDPKVKTRLKIKNYSDAYRTIVNRKLVISQSFTQLVISQGILISETFQNFTKANFRAIKYKQALEVFGSSKLEKIYDESVAKKNSIINEKLLQHNLARFERAINVLIPSIDEISLFNWDYEHFITKVQEHPDFSTWFQILPIGESWNDYKYLEEFVGKMEKKLVDVETCRIPIDIIRVERFRNMFDKHIAKIVEISQYNQVKINLEKQMTLLMEEKAFTIKSTIEEIQKHLYNKGFNDLSNALQEPCFKSLFTRMHQGIILKSKIQYHELLFEYSLEIENLKLETRSTIVEAISSLVMNDERYQKFNQGFESFRDSWSFNHFTFSRNFNHCLMSPVHPCIKGVARSVLSTITNQFASVDSSVFEELDSITLFVISNDELFKNFEVEFKNQGTMSGSEGTYGFSVNGNYRYFNLVLIDSQNVDWNSVLEKFSDRKYGFVALYGDSSTFKFVESSMIRYYHYLFDERKRNHNDVGVSCSSIDTNFSSGRNSVISKTPNVNIVILFCLLPDVVEDYKSFTSKIDTEIFFQESLLGKILEQGKILSIKYNSKLIDSFYDSLSDENEVRMINETQVSDSLRYLCEILFGENRSLQASYDETRTVKLLFCVMCGDEYPLEILLGLFLFGRKFEYNITQELLYFEFQCPNTNGTFLAALRVSPYHGASNIISSWDFDGCILAYSIKRKCSLQVLKSFCHKLKSTYIHILGVEGCSSSAGIQLQTSCVVSEVEKMDFEGLEAKISGENSDMWDQVNSFNSFLVNCKESLDNKVLEMKINSQNQRLQSSVDIDNQSYSTLQWSSKSDAKKHKTISSTKFLSNLDVKRIDFSQDMFWAVNPAFASNSSLESKNQEEGSDKKTDSEEASSFETPKKNLKHISFRGFKTATQKLMGIGNTKSGTLTKKSDRQVVNNQVRDLTSQTSRTPSFTGSLRIKKNTMSILSSIKGKAKRNSERLSIQDKMAEWDKLKTSGGASSSVSGSHTPPTSMYFGKDLTQITTAGVPPLFVKKCIAYVEEHALKTQGIYRVSGNKQDVESLKSTFESDHDVDFNSLGYNHHVICTALKSFFSSLPTTLVPKSLNLQILNATTKPNPNDRVTELSELMLLIPHTNRASLSLLAKHLYKVTNFSSINKMEARNLAICFWPALLDISDQSIGNFSTSGVHFCLFINILIENHKLILDSIDPEESENVERTIELMDQLELLPADEPPATSDTNISDEELNKEA